MPDQLRATYDDYDGDAQTTSLNVQPLSEFADHAAWFGAQDALKTQLDLITSGRAHRYQRIVDVVDNGPGKASSPVAQSAIQLILEIEDTVNLKTFKERVPFPSLTISNDGGGDPAWISQGQGSASLTVLNPAHDVWGTLKAAYDAVGASPDGNPAILLRAYIEE